MPKSNTNAGLARGHAPSHLQKRVFIGLHAAILMVCGYIALEVEMVGQARALALVFVAMLYFGRHIITLFYLLQRKVAWGEALGLALFMTTFEIGFVWLGGQSAAPFGMLDVLGLLLLGFGSYLNTFSEVQRKWWKADPTHKGQCYTLGLFRYAMHINFFGDIVLFSGWALLTANLWALGLPLLMGAMFAFIHIPGLDAYLAQRYGAAFEACAAKTKKLIPYIY
ncbi:MAG: DUF1295 domain-containing protein [Rhodobacteraceae bacterium]|nr:DUF1295 domain-containing protein [Paracoccaceae bacterium]